MASYVRAAVKASVIDVVIAPVWYYTGGVVVMYRWLIDSITGAWHMMAVGLWVRHIFTPMFQQHDWQGRIISFFMRLVQIVVRLIGFIILAVALATVFVGFICVPLVLVGVLFTQLV